MKTHETVRTRFAPSPTGFLHIGGVRTALYCWLYARKHKGQFLLRIEDTDLERSEERYTQDILASMTWLGLNWDEAPLYQSKRLDIYRAKVEELIQKNLAYRCTCTEADVERMRERATAEGRRPQYDRTCREKKLPAPAPGTPYVIRLKVPLDGGVEFDDLIRGPIRVENTEVDDFVLIRSNGAPTYNLSVVVDDVESRISHVIRGDDHINNTPKQIHLYQYFGYAIPRFAHLPMILGPDKKKLSKRHGAVSANVYRGDGFLPEALLNFLARLGWSHGDQEVFSVQEMIDFFSFDHCQKASAVFNSEKLLWLNGVHIRNSSAERLQKIVCEDDADYFVPEGSLERAKSKTGEKLVSLIQPKVKLVKEIAEQLVPLCTPGAIEVDPKAELKWGKSPGSKEAIQAAVRQITDFWAQKMKDVPRKPRLAEDSVWGDSPSLEDAGIGHQEVDAQLRQFGEQHGVKLGELAQPMRLTVTGRLVSAGLFELLALLPWDVVEPRLRKVSAL